MATTAAQRLLLLLARTRGPGCPSTPWTPFRRPCAKMPTPWCGPMTTKVVTVKSAGRLVHTVHRVITVLDAAGDATWAATLVVYYDALSSMSYLRGAVYDADGRLLHQLRAGRIRATTRRGRRDGGSFMTDVRLRYADLRQPTTPTRWSSTTKSCPTTRCSTPELAAPGSTRAWPCKRHPARDHAHGPAPALPGAAAARRRARGPHQHRQPGNLRLAAGQPAGRGRGRSRPAAGRPARPPWCWPPARSRCRATRAAASWQGLGQWSYELNAGRDVLPPATTGQGGRAGERRWPTRVPGPGACTKCCKAAPATFRCSWAWAAGKPFRPAPWPAAATATAKP